MHWDFQLRTVTSRQFQNLCETKEHGPNWRNIFFDVKILLCGAKWRTRGVHSLKQKQEVGVVMQYPL